MSTQIHYDVYETRDGTVLQDCFGTAFAENPLEAVKAVCREHYMDRGSLEGGAFVVRSEDADEIDAGGQYHDVTVREGATVTFVDEDEVFDALDADEVAALTEDDDSTPIFLGNGAVEFEDGLRLLTSGFVVLGRDRDLVQHAAVDVYRVDGWQAGICKGRVYVRTLGLESMPALTLRRLVEEKLAEREWDDVASAA